MIPLKDSTPSQTFPIVTIGLIIINSLAFFYELSLGPQVNSLFETYGLIPARFINLLQHNPTNISGMAVPFVSSVFLHWLEAVLLTQ